MRWFVLFVVILNVFILFGDSLLHLHGKIDDNNRGQWIASIVLSLILTLWGVAVLLGEP